MMKRKADSNAGKSDDHQKAKRQKTQACAKPSKASPKPVTNRPSLEEKGGHQEPTDKKKKRGDAAAGRVPL